MKKLIILILSLFIFDSNAQEKDWEKIEFDLKILVTEFIINNVSAKEHKKILKNLNTRALQRSEDTGLAVDICYRTIMLDWAAANIENLINRDSQAIKVACIYFKEFLDKGYTIPAIIRERITDENLEAIRVYLKQIK